MTLWCIYTKTHAFLFLKRVISTFLLAGLCLYVSAQLPSQSNLRRKSISTSSTIVRLDSVSLIPGSFSVIGIPDSTYQIDYVNARLVWLYHPEKDSVSVVYRVFPGRLNQASQRMKFDTIMGKFVVTPLTMQMEKESAALFDFGNINYNGSFGRGLAFGNRQDVVVNSTLNLQINGYIGDSIQLAAALTDNNIPIQPDGNTQNLNEFDQVYIQFSKEKWRLSVGDIDVRQSQDYFLNFYKRLQGGSFETENRVGKDMRNKMLVSGAVAKGKFTRNIFQGLEGNQGPYRLKGANSELFFIVLAGTERVFIDGVLMQRGEDQDYVINYNTAEITFTPRQLITKDKRIQIEFEYADRNYLNAQLYLRDEFQLNPKLKVRVGAYHNNDSKNSSINQTLDAAQKQFLADIGDSVQYAYYPSAVVDTLTTGKILYEKIDTAYSSTASDSVYIYSVNSQKTLYSLSFVDVGAGRGNYELDLNSNANGKVYRWIAPDTLTGKKRGQYEPAQLLIAPRKQQVFTVGADYAIDPKTQVRAEMAVSVLDVNTFSSKDKGNDQGLAGRVRINNARPLSGTRGLELKTGLNYEYIQADFRPLERLRNVEFNRDWGLAFDAPPAAENLVAGTVGLQDKKGNSADLVVSGYFRSDGYSGFRNAIVHKAEIAGWRVNNLFTMTSIDQQEQKGYFVRPVVDINRQIPGWKNYLVGFNYQLERSEMAYKAYDSLNPTSFSFDIIQVYLKSPENLPNRWGLTYYTRSDKHPFGSELLRTDRSQNINLYAELMQNEHHQFRVNASYRELNVTDAKLTTLKPDETLLGRAEYLANVWKGAVNGNALYELGTGQEPRRDYSYVEVPAGQGEYTWIDYNNDGIQQINEFELARFQDQAKYIRIFTPTTDFIKANYLQFNYSVVFNPRAAINLARAGGLVKFISRIYFQSSLQIGKKSISDGIGGFNPFDSDFSDSSLLTLEQILGNSFSFNRSSSVWGFDVNNIRSSARAFLSYGYETRQFNDWSLKTRVTFLKQYTFDITARRIINELITPQFNNRNFLIEGNSVEPRFTYTLKTVFRAQLSYKWDKKVNTGGEISQIRSIITDAKCNVLSNTSLNARFTYSQIKYNGAPNTTVSYIMMDGLLPGQNYLWTVDMTQRLSSFLELSFQYEGRKAGTSGIVHVGRAQIRALF
jgi:hypothetical protein